MKYIKTYELKYRNLVYQPSWAKDRFSLSKFKIGDKVLYLDRKNTIYEITDIETTFDPLFFWYRIEAISGEKRYRKINASSNDLSKATKEDIYNCKLIDNAEQYNL